MPLTAKGKTILTAMQGEYGPKQGKSVFYASINAGKVRGAEKTGSRKALKPKRAMA